MENPIKWMIWGYPYFWKHPYKLFSSKKLLGIVFADEQLRKNMAIFLFKLRAKGRN